MITQAQAIAKSKNGVIDIVSLGAELRAAHNEALNTSSDDSTGWDFGGITDAQRDALLAAHEGAAVAVAVPLVIVEDAGDLYAQTSDGKRRKLTADAPIERVR